MKEILERIKTAIEVLKDGFPFKVGDLYMRVSDDCFNVTGVSWHSDTKYITKQEAKNELEELKSLFDSIVSSSAELRNLIGDKQIKFNLNFNYGMGKHRNLF